MDFISVFQKGLPFVSIGLGVMCLVVLALAFASLYTNHKQKSGKIN